MKKWYGSVLSTSLLMLSVLGYFAIKNPIKVNYITSPYLNTTSPHLNTTNPLEWINSVALPSLSKPENKSQMISAKAIVPDIFAQRNLSNEELQSLHTWNRLKHLITHTQMLPNAVEAVKEAAIEWDNLMTSFEEEKLHMNGSSLKRGKQKQCPHFLSKINASQLDDNGFQLQLPCGLTQGSSLTIVGIPNGLLGNFRIDLTGEPLPDEPYPPIILHYNVRHHGDKLTEEPVIVQNSWASAHDWGKKSDVLLLILKKTRKWMNWTNAMR